MNFFFYACRLKWLPDFKPVAISCIVLLLSIGVGATVSPPENDFKITTLFLVRHAEKAATPPEDPPLLESGNRRAQQLGRILMKAGIKAIYTSQYLRTKQTAEPLAKNLGIESTVIRIRMSANNPREISQESMKEIAEKVYERAGENALIVGHSNTIPEVIRALGGDVVPTIDEKEYDDLFVVTVYAKGKAKVTHLKYGDEK
ncbi:MAG TPA: phosphoglycerate mutase family protein [Blastocatellia bacterium]|nr:phosphoglycerate mutase family protein [Blastocatellia bacterium]